MFQELNKLVADMNKEKKEQEEKRTRRKQIETKFDSIIQIINDNKYGEW